MEGVRRWMRSQPLVDYRQSHNKIARRPEQKGAKADKFLPADTNSTEYIVNQLLDPVVPENEMIEYQM